MKTNFRISTTVFTLALIGVLNANAAVNFAEKNSGLYPGNENSSVLNEKIASFESDLNENIDYRMEAQMVTRLIADIAEAKAIEKVMERGFVAPQETSSSFENEAANETTDFGKEAQLMTKWIADMAEAKATQRVIENGFVAPQETSSSFENEAANETTDFGKEAQLMTKWIADMAEAKATQRVIENGFVAPQETSFYVEDENNNEITDFGKEAQLMTKWIADMAEAKAIQKVMDRGFVAPNETSSSFENEAENETTDFGKEAQLMTKWIADLAEAKAVQKVMERGFVAPNEIIYSTENEAGFENNDETTDLAKEAQLITKLIADREEAKAVQKVMEKGFVAPNETSSTSENEAGIENKDKTTDLAKEAQIMIKLIADQAEAKAIQKVMEKGFVSQSETINSFENEVGYENNVETTDFRKEAQIMSKQIADQEEAKVVQKLTVEDKLAENK